MIYRWYFQQQIWAFIYRTVWLTKKVSICTAAEQNIGNAFFLYYYFTYILCSYYPCVNSYLCFTLISALTPEGHALCFSNELTVYALQLQNSIYNVIVVVNGLKSHRKPPEGSFNSLTLQAATCSQCWQTVNPLPQVPSPPAASELHTSKRLQFDTQRLFS